MADNRIFQQLARGFGTTDSVVTCVIDGNTVFVGNVFTVNEPVPHPLPNPDYLIDNVAWTWTTEPDFEGSQSLSISVTGSPLLLAESLANDPYANITDVYTGFFSDTIANVLYYDPFTDEAIDGVPQSGPPNPDQPGQWWWLIPAGSTFTATINVMPPPEHWAPFTPNPPDAPLPE